MVKDYTWQLVTKVRMVPWGAALYTGTRKMEN